MYNQLLSGSRLRIGPLADMAAPAEVSRERVAESVTMTTVTFPMPGDLKVPETNVLYFKASEDALYKALGAILTAVEFHPLQVSAYPVWYSDPIVLPGSLFPLHRERTATIRFLSEFHQFECDGTIDSSSTISFHLPPSSSIPGDKYDIAVQFGRSSAQSFLETGVTINFYEVIDFEPECIVANATAWNQESSFNYISIWGLAFSSSQSLKVSFLDPVTNDDIGYDLEAIYASENEMVAQMDKMPPSGEWKVKFVPIIPDHDNKMVGANAYIIPITLTVVRATSYFPHFGELHPQFPEAFTISHDSSIDLNVSQPVTRWQAQDSNIYMDATDVTMFDNVFVTDIPTFPAGSPDPSSTTFSIQLCVGNHSKRVYGTLGAKVMSMEKLPIFRTVDPDHVFKFLSVKAVTPRCVFFAASYILLTQAFFSQAIVDLMAANLF